MSVESELARLADLTRSTLQTYEPDPCCGRALARALESLAAAASWTCPRCGCEWKPTESGGVRHWIPQVDVLIWKP